MIRHCLSPMPLKPQLPPCFDSIQRGGPTVQAWLFTLSVSFYANYVSEDTAKIRYAVSLLRGPAMDWWRVIVTKDYATLPTREGQTGPWAPSYFVEVPQYRTWDAWCADYTSGFLVLCEQVGYMYESVRIDRYIGGLKHDIAQEIQLRGVTDFQEIFAMAEKLEFFRRPRPGPEKDGGFCLCIDYRTLNTVTIKSHYPIPRADDLIDQLRTAQIFSKIDIRGGFHQIRFNPPDCPKTAFRIRYESFEYTVMPFGLTNTPATFQMTMNEAFRPLLDNCVIVYLDDILIYSPDRAQHLQDIEALFRILSENCLLKKAYKSELLQDRLEFLQDRLEFLGHIISAEGVRIDPKNIVRIQAWHAPTNLTELQSFLGFVNYVRQFVPDMAKLTAPLTDLLRKGVEYTWGEKEQAAFSALKQFLCSPPVLHIADPHRPFELVSDASDIAVGVVLFQDFGKGLQPIAYESRKLHPPERNYSIHDREMLAILHAFKVWRCYLTGADVTHHVGSCPTCQAMKSLRTRKAGYLLPIPPPERAWQQVTMDFIARLPSNPGGNNAVMVVVERLTKVAHFNACKKSISAEETARLFIAAVVRLHGIPAAIISDHDTKFTNNFWKNPWEQFGTRLQFSSSYHPETDGQTEQTNQTME
ncbi:unnamed protein product [Closterium sp. NIES-54]